MAVIIACRSCGRKLRVGEDQVGRKVRCPGCKDTFVAEEVGEEPDSEGFGTEPSYRGREQGDSGSRYPARRDDEDLVRHREEEYEDDYEEGRRRKASPTAGWKKVRLGLALFLAAIITYIVGNFALWALSFAVLGSAFSPGATLTGFAAGLFLLAAVGFLVSLAWWGLYVGGNCLFLFVPDKPGTGIRGLGIASCAVAISAVGLELLGTMASIAEIGSAAFTSGFRGGSAMGSMLTVLGWLVIVLGYVPVSIFFLRAIALAMKRKQLARLLVMWLIWAGILIGVFIVLTIVMCGIGLMVGAQMASVPGNYMSGSTASGNAAFGSAVGGMAVLFYLACAMYLLFALAWLAMTVWYVVLVFQVRNAVDYRLRH
jgi:hypothetical protein